MRPLPLMVLRGSSPEADFSKKSDGQLLYLTRPRLMYLETADEFFRPVITFLTLHGF
jgi:hypothetical protein